MTRSAVFGNAFLAVVAAACVPIFLAACMAFRYPVVRYVPGVDLPEPITDLRCFRVDVDTARKAGEVDLEDRSFLLTELTVPASGRIPGQTLVTSDFAYFGIGGSETDRHVVLIHLYRPGYELVEIAPWEKLGSIAWKKAANLSAQEKAVDDLLTVRFAAPRTGWKARLHFESPQLASAKDHAAHKKALLFAIDEYERLAAEVVPDNEKARILRIDMRSKANWLREWTEKDEWPEVDLDSKTKPPAVPIPDQLAKPVYSYFPLSTFP
jgi:hypothetical protein